MTRGPKSASFQSFGALRQGRRAWEAASQCHSLTLCAESSVSSTESCLPLLPCRREENDHTIHVAPVMAPPELADDQHVGSIRAVPEEAVLSSHCRGRMGCIHSGARDAGRVLASMRSRWPAWLAIAQLCCVAYILVLTFSPAPLGAVQPGTGFIDPAPRPTVLATDRRAMCNARDFPRVGLCALSAVGHRHSDQVQSSAVLGRTGPPIEIHVKLLNSHEMHAKTGRFVGAAALLHTVAHCIRWALQRNLGRLLLGTTTGVSGLVAIVLLPLISLPMMLPPSVRARVSYEVRKTLHYLFIPFCAALAAPCAYGRDPKWRLHRIRHGVLLGPVGGRLDLLLALADPKGPLSPTSKWFPNGVQMTLPIAADRSEGFVYVCVPWVSKHQWHAFSIFPNPHNRSLGHVHMQACGDWTSAVHRAVQVSTRAAGLGARAVPHPLQEGHLLRQPDSGGFRHRDHAGIVGD